MTQVFLTSADTSPWNKPGDWADAGHTVELVGAGGDGGAGTSGVSTNRCGVGGGGGGYYKLTYSSGTLAASTAFAIHANNSSATSFDTNATYWNGTTNTNSYEAQCGKAGQNSGTSTTGGAGGAGLTNGTPVGGPVYTTTTHTGGSGGTGTTAAASTGGSGGGGAAGPGGDGKNGGNATGTSQLGGAGGGGSNGGSSTAGGTTSTSTGANGGDGTGGTGHGVGGAAGTIGGSATANSGGGGGGGGGGNATLTNVDISGGAGAGDQAFDSTHGAGGGGGGGGGNSATSSTGVTSRGGSGANYGGGSGGSGGLRASGTNTSKAGAGGLIVITYTPAGGSTFVPYNSPQQMAILIQAAQPDSWAYDYLGPASGLQPYAPRQFGPIDSVTNNPPFVQAERKQQQNIVTQVSQPDPWVYNYLGPASGLQPYAPRNFGPITRTIDNPPGYMETVVVWGEDDLPPTLGNRFFPFPTVVPPTKVAYSPPWFGTVIQAWVESAWAYTFLGPASGLQPYAPRQFGPPERIINDPPRLTRLSLPYPDTQVLPTIPIRYVPSTPATSQVPFVAPWFTSIIQAWADIPYQPQLPKTVGPGIPGRSVDNPPRLKRQDVQYPDIVFPPQLARNVGPGIPGRSVDNPPLLRPFKLLYPETPVFPVFPPPGVAAIIPPPVVSATYAYTRPWLSGVLQAWAEMPYLPPSPTHIASLIPPPTPVITTEIHCLPFFATLGQMKSF